MTNTAKFSITKATAFEPDATKPNTKSYSVRLAIAGTSMWIHQANFPELFKDYNPSATQLELPVPLKEHFRLVKKHSDKGDFLSLLPKCDLELSPY